MQGEFENLLLDTQKEYSRSNRMKDKIIIVVLSGMKASLIMLRQNKQHKMLI